MNRRGWATRTLIAVLPFGLAACTVTGHPSLRATWHAKPVVPINLAVAPRAGDRNLPISTEISTEITGGTVTGVSLTDSAGRAVSGAMRADGSSWVPAAPLAYGHSYTATVTAANPTGQRQTRTTTFTTMADPGSNTIDTGLYFQSGNTYGVGMPIVIDFDEDIPDSAKATVERRLFVTSDPPQIGVWHWQGDREVLYRPQVYWQPGTKVTVRAALAGVPVGGHYLDQDRGGTATIGPKQVFVVRNETKRMYVYQNDKLTRTFPVSLGKSSTPTSSGNFVLMSHDYSTLFATPEYRITAYYAERFTWGGQYLHAAPWSEGEQGFTNVSHGCVNLSTSNAAWVYGISQVGDPVTVTGTEVHLTPGDGWTVWDMSWSDYLKGSALPHPDLEALAAQNSRWKRIGN